MADFALTPDKYNLIPTGEEGNTDLVSVYDTARDQMYSVTLARFVALAGGGGVDVEEGGVAAATAADTLDFVKMSVTDNGGGNVSIQPYLGSLPTTSAIVIVEADAGIAVADGVDLGTWSDQSGVGDDFTEATNKPVYRATDAEDGLPYVEFTSGNSDQLRMTRTAGLYTGTEMTYYAVMRVAYQSGKQPFGFSQDGESESAGIRPTQTINTSKYIVVGHNGTGYNTATQTEHAGWGRWSVYAVRLDTRMGQGNITIVWDGNCRSDYIATPAANDWDTCRLGCAFGNFGNAGNFMTGDMRAFAVYGTAHTDLQMQQTITYLRRKWNADPFHFNY